MGSVRPSVLPSTWLPVVHTLGRDPSRQTQGCSPLGAFFHWITHSTAHWGCWWEAAARGFQELLRRAPGFMLQGGVLS
jgi:hypothetical protein